ncbi:MAG: hypothetical protein K8I00_04140, partial [Candidatus Omnitrophica bacterium]|nr:hypothetical protein [Candidatus Omnitrophota bacterium]
MAQNILKIIRDKYSYYKVRLRYKTLYPSGHYYSPIPSAEEIEARKDVLFHCQTKDLPAVDLNEAGQLALLESFPEFYPDLPFQDTKNPDMRYYYDNIFYGHSDVICLYS